MNLKVILIILLMVSASRVNGANKAIYTEKITSQDGLYSNRFFKAYRDNAGYLWIAGINGVAKYDGLHITNFTEHTDSSKLFIGGIRFYDVIQDKSNTIWIGGDSGLHKFDAHKNSFRHIAPKTIKNARFLRILNDSVLWVSCTNKRNYHVNYLDNSVVETTEISYTTSIILDNSGVSWKSTSEGCIIYDNQDTVLNVKTHISDICFTPSGDLYVGTNSGLVIVPHSEIGKEQKTLTQITEFDEKIKLTNNSVTTVEYANNHVWVGTRKGLNKVQLNENGELSEIIHYYNQPDNPYSLSNNQINDIYTDREGIMWISTHGGLNKIDPQHLWFYSYRNNPENANSLHSNNIFPIDGDIKGKVWFGSYESGVSKLNTINKQFTWFNNSTGVGIKNVRYIYTDITNKTWLVADDKLFFAERNELLTANIIDKDGQPFSYQRIHAIIQHPNGNFWVGIDNQIVELEQVSDNTFKYLRSWNADSYVICFYVDSYNRIWAGTSSAGIALVDLKNDVGILKFNRTTNSVFRTNAIQAINQDSEGNLWMGSLNGLYRVKNDSVFQHAPRELSIKGFFEENGLTNNYVTGILPDENGVLWLSSWKGIMKYDPGCIKLCRFMPFTFSDGLIDEKYNRNGAYLDEKTNTYYFGSANGVNYFNPIIEAKTKVLPQVLVNQVQVNGDQVFLYTTENTTKNEPRIVANILKKGSIDQLFVQFGSSSLLSPPKQVFAWKLEGKDDKWTFSRNRELLLQHIEPGDYVLKIRAATKEGKLGAPVLIHVQVKSYVATVLKAGFLFLLIVVFGFFIFRRRKVNTTEKKKENKYEFSKLTDDKSARAANRLSGVMTTEKPYLQSDLTAEKLAKMVGVSQGELSQVLNEYLNTKFYEYVNKHRVEEFIRLLKTSDAEKLTLSALAEECGFSSKSTFYRAFNNEKGMTPAQFAKSFKKKS